jgi:hypothetical protein
LGLDEKEMEWSNVNDPTIVAERRAMELRTQVADLTRERDEAREDAAWEMNARRDARKLARDELEKLRKYALLDSTHWEKLGDPKECAFPEGWSPPQPRPDYVPPDREGDEVLHRFRLGFRNINGLSMRDRDETLNELCRRELARGEGGR